MLNQEEINKIKETTKEFFSKTSFDIDLEISKPEEETISIKIKTSDPKVLIGQNGQTLAEIQHLLKSLLRRKIQSDFYIDLDVNDYKKKKAEYLKSSASEWADEVAISGKEKILAPMSSYERRIVHMQLASRKDVVTESIGKEPERKIVIKPYTS
jgi:spoIIIJ-associated protein